MSSIHPITISESQTTDSILDQFKNSSNLLIVTVYYIYQSVLTTQSNLQVLADEIRANSAAQNYLNNQQALYQYVTIPKNTLYNPDGSLNDKITSAYLQEIQAENQAIGASKQAIQNQLGALNNSSQVVTSNLNTNNNIIQQSLQVGQALLQTFSQIVSLISNI